MGPVFWGYGAMAGNYTAIIAVGGLLLGIAYRGRSSPKYWQPFAASIVLAIGTGYRQDIGVFWLPVFAVILWQHRWKPAIISGLMFTALNLAWLTPMLLEAGGWTRYRAASAEFAREAGYLNSVWNLGFTDGPLRYAVKLAMALVWTLGPALVFVPRGAARLGRLRGGWFLGMLMVLAALPALMFPSLGAFWSCRLQLSLRSGSDGAFGTRREPFVSDRLHSPGIVASLAGRHFRGGSDTTADCNRAGHGGSLLVLSDRLLAARLARQLRPVVLPVHADRTQNPAAGPRRRSTGGPPIRVPWQVYRFADPLVRGTAPDSARIMYRSNARGKDFPCSESVAQADELADRSSAEFLR